MPYLHQIDPIALELGPLSIHWYGITYLVAFGVGWWLGQVRLRAGRLPVSADAWSDLAFWIMLGVVVGGRFGYLLVYGWKDWIEDPLVLFKLWQGGMSFHGGLVGVMCAVWYWSVKQKLAFWDVLDFVAPLVPTGIVAVRIGNFIGGELWGRKTDMPWGVVFPNALPQAFPSQEALLAAWRAGELAGEARHPSQLYHAALEGLALFLVLWWFTSRPRPRYAACGVFAVGYAVCRIAVEFFREPDRHIGFLAGGWLTMGMVLCVPLALVGIALLLLSRRSPTLAPAAVAAEARP
jgi:phosphatidylglycerol:prolipoprotein diacylglycerol transferase